VLRADQVADLLSLNIDYIRKLSREGTIPAHRVPGGRTFRYFKDEVLQWLRDQPAHDPEPSSDGETTRDSTRGDGPAT
jgi:excisionase family DNA binding protein